MARKQVESEMHQSDEVVADRIKMSALSMNSNGDEQIKVADSFE